MESGEAKIKDRVVCPEGAGEVVKVYNADNILIKLDEKNNGKEIFAAYDLSDCKLEKI